MLGTRTLIQYPGLTRNLTLSPPCAKARMALIYKGLDHDVLNVNLPSEIKRYSSRGRVPILVDDGDVIVDSTDIVTALEDRYPRPALEPSAPRLKAQARMLEDWADEVLYFYGVYVRWCIEANFERMRREVLSRLPLPARWLAPGIARRQIRRRTRGQGVGLKDETTVRRELHECLEWLSRLLDDRPFLVGGELCRADLAVAAVLDQLLLAQLTPQTAAAIQRQPEIMNWLDRVHESVPNLAAPPPEGEA